MNLNKTQIKAEAIAIARSYWQSTLWLANEKSENGKKLWQSHCDCREGLLRGIALCIGKDKVVKALELEGVTIPPFLLS